MTHALSGVFVCDVVGFWCCSLSHARHEQCEFVETHLQDVPVVAQSGGKLETNVAWSELEKVLFLVNGSRCVLVSAAENVLSVLL